MPNIRIQNSPGLRPDGVSGSLLDDPTVKGSYFQFILGPLPSRNLALPTSRSHFFDPWALHGSIFSFLGPIGKASKNDVFVGMAPKLQKSEDKSNVGGPCHHFGSKSMTFEVPFGIVFSSFL